MVTMTHPDLPDQPIEVMESSVPVHRQSGWRTTDENPDATETTQKPPRGRSDTPATAATDKE